MVTINGQLYNKPLDKGLPYYRIDAERGIAAILPYGATKYSTFNEHIMSLETFFSRQVALTPIIINSYAHNRLELSSTRTNGRRIPLPTYLKEGLDGPGLMYDHINNDATDDTDDNLRPVTATQNSYNKKLAKNNTSGFKGVVRTKSSKGTYGAVIWQDGKIYSGLTFANAAVAALSYNELAKIHHGEYAGLNPVTDKVLQDLTKDPNIRESLIKDLTKLDKRYGTDWLRVVC